MATTTEKTYKVAKLEELEPALAFNPQSDDRRHRFDIRRNLDITAFGVNAFQAPAEVDIINEHQELGFASDGQEELYIVTSGAATFTIDDEEVEAPVGSYVRVRPEAKRKAVAKEDGTTIVAIGGTPGKAYDPAPIEAGEAFAAYNAGDYETALAKQKIVLEKRPKDPVAHFNTACFAARLGRADEAIEHLKQSIEIDERVKELIRTDEDLDSIREDPRFAELVK
jgi:tetratricopeptide (TPR) repeat protein